MSFGVVLLTIICLLFIIGIVSTVVSIIYEKELNKQYVPTQPTRPVVKPLIKNKELATDIADDYFSEFDFDDVIVSD